MHRVRTDLADGYLARYEGRQVSYRRRRFPLHQRDPLDAREEFLYIVETTGGCVSRLRIDEKGAARDREIFGPRASAKAPGPMVSPSTASAIYGAPWCTPTSCSSLRPKAISKSCSTEGDRNWSTRSSRAIARPGSESRCIVRHRPRHRALDGERHLRRPRSGEPSYIGSLKGSRIPYFRSPNPRPADGPLERLNP